MVWTELSVQEANAVVTKYGICYKESDTRGNICDKSRDDINKDQNTFTLIGLNEYTSYDVAVRAGTSDGFGPVGKFFTATTKQDGK